MSGTAGNPRSPSPVPTTAGQHSLWLHQTMHRDSRAYNVTGASWLDGPLDIGAMRAATRAVVDRHDSLRSVFLLTEGQVRREVRPVASDLPELRDLAGASVAQARVDTVREVDAAVDHAFDLESGPLFWLRLLRLRPDRHLLLLSAHHIVADGWSMDLFYRELSVCYRQAVAGDRISLPQLDVDCAEYARQQQLRMADGWEGARRYWSARLAGLPPELRLPTPDPRPAERSFLGATIESTVEGDLPPKIHALVRRAGVTVFATLLTVYALTLYRLSGQRRFAVGVVSANRDRAGAGGVVGMVANLLPMRFDIDTRKSFAGLVRDCRTELLDTQEHQEYPFDQMVDLAGSERVPGVPPLVQVLFDLEYEQAGPLDLPGVTATPVPVPVRTSKFDLSMIVRDLGDRVQLTLEYDSALFDEEWAREFTDCYIAVLAAVVDDPGEPVHRLLPVDPASTATSTATPTPAVAVAETGSTTEAEDLVLRLCVEVMGDRQPRSVEDDFVASGGSSLMAVRLVYRIYEETGVTIPATQVLRYSRLRELAAVVEELRSRTASGQPGTAT